LFQRIGVSKGHMKILVVGGGGREHAMLWKLAQSPRRPQLFCAPGNPGIAALAACVPIKADDVSALKAFAQRQGIDLTLVGPEAPLALGMADEFRKAKLKIFGPTKHAARLESSKIFSKDIMAKAGIRTARAQAFDRPAEALAYVDKQAPPVVIKADGLAQGKGVLIAGNAEEARRAIVDSMERAVFGAAGKQILIEDYLNGEELTVMAFTDGRTVAPMLPAQDHKRIGDGDTGLNTGGMGAYCPAPLGTPALRAQVTREVLQPVVDVMSRLGSPFQGVLYAGLMVVDGLPYVLEFNARMGDPETQAVLPLLKTDLIEVVEAVVEHRLDQVPVEWHDGHAVCVVMTSAGYPATYEVGDVIQGLDDLPSDGALVFHAGTATNGQHIVTAGGRVLGVTGRGASLAEAQAAAYRTVKQITFRACHYRQDIAYRALAPRT
jgi:phosphoribosylamine--glycine ligase